MVRDCIDNDKPFGVVLIKKGVEAHGEADPHAIGCTARIAQTEMQDNGNIHIVAVGEQRFRILALEHDRPYLVGQVMTFPMEQVVEPQTLQAANSRLMPLLERYVNLLSQIGEAHFDKQQLPDDAVSMAYIAAYLLQIPTVEKQQFLGTTNPLQLFDSLRTVYRREVSFLKVMLEHKDAAGADSNMLFSLN
jgi:Lon protease-like protein